MIKAILIDIDNTLLDFNLNARAAMREAFKDCDMEYEEEYFSTFLKVNTALWEQIEKKQITREDLKRDRFKLILLELGISGDSAQLEALFRKYLGEFAIPVEGANELLEYLSKKYKIYAASNAMHQQQVKRLTKAKMIKYFEKLFMSELVGADKPSKSFFDYCFLNMGNVTKEEAIMIGDSLSADIEGAKNYGLKSIWFNAHAKTPSNSALADYIVYKLKEIEEIL